MLIGLVLMGFGLIPAAINHLPPPGAHNVPVSFAFMCFGCAFLVNAFCGIKYKKTVGKGGTFSDANWIDVAMNVGIAVMIAVVIFRLWNAPLSRIH
jgi:hypothetical protein